MDILNFEDIQLVRKQTVLLQDINWQIAKKSALGTFRIKWCWQNTFITTDHWDDLADFWQTRQVLGQVYGKTSVPDLQRRIGWISATLQEKIPAQELSEMVVLSGKYASIGIYEDYQMKDLNQAIAILFVQLAAVN